MNQDFAKNNNNPNVTEKADFKTDFLAIMEQILSFLPERTKIIFKRRYGLAGEKGETLEQIGADYNITRERVRQIVADAQKIITSRIKETDFSHAEQNLIFTIENNNGIIKESQIIDKFNINGIKLANVIKFLANCSHEIKTVEEKDVLERSWIISLKTKERAISVIKKAEEILKNEHRVIGSEILIKKINNFFPELSEKEIKSYLNVSIKIKKNQFEKWGICNWPEINPKGTREKVYLVLKEKNQPLHFTRIAGYIDEYKLGKKNAHPQTVHNELIKDSRFVLVGRGIYALAEWGYEEGTIKDVLVDIIGEVGHPVSREEILEEVMKRRKVKKSTVLINLNNRDIFKKQKDLYTLKR